MCPNACRRVVTFLSNGLGRRSITVKGVGAVTVAFPNRAADICLANRSHAMLLQGRMQEALDDAEAAVKSCPEYVKAHKRCMEVLGKLGKRTEAEEIRNTVSAYENLSGQLPWYGAALFAANWITDEEHILVYQQYWRNRCFKKACEAGAKAAGQSLNATVSLVNFMDGQWCMCGFKYMPQNWKSMTRALELTRRPQAHAPTHVFTQTDARGVRTGGV